MSGSYGSARCGTPEGMRAHQILNEPPCKWCKAAVEAPKPKPAPEPVKPKPAPKAKRTVTQPATSRRMARMERPPCGTVKGYNFHVRHGEERDDACKAAIAERQRTRYAERRDSEGRPAKGPQHGSQRMAAECTDGPNGGLCELCDAKRLHLNAMARKRHQANAKPRKPAMTPEERNAKRRAARAANKDEVNARDRARRAADKEARNAARRDAYARKKQAELGLAA